MNKWDSTSSNWRSATNLERGGGVLDEEGGWPSKLGVGEGFLVAGGEEVGSIEGVAWGTKGPTFRSSSQVG